MGMPSQDQVLGILRTALGVDAAECVWGLVEMELLIPALLAAIPTEGASLVAYFGPLFVQCG